MFRKSKREIINGIIEDNLDYLVRFAYYRTSNRSVAEDIVYDAILKFLERKPENIRPESVRTYLFRIVHNLCHDRSRTGIRNLVSLEGLEIADTSSEIFDLEDADKINVCLDGLPTREAEVIRMNVVDNLSFVEISAILAIPQSTAKSRYKSGMDKLRKSFINNKKS